MKTAKNTECCGRMADTTASCSGDFGLGYRPGGRLSWLRGFVVFLSLSAEVLV